jgi:hypothetical protein
MLGKRSPQYPIDLNTGALLCSIVCPLSRSHLPSSHRTGAGGAGSSAVHADAGGGGGVVIGAVHQCSGRLVHTAAARARIRDLEAPQGALTVSDAQRREAVALAVRLVCITFACVGLHAWLAVYHVVRLEHHFFMHAGVVMWFTCECVYWAASVTPSLNAVLVWRASGPALWRWSHGPVT